MRGARPWVILKKLAPKSLFGRALIILVSPILLVQIVLSYLFFDRHLDVMLTQMATNVAGEMQVIAVMLDGGEDKQRLQQLAQDHLDIKFLWQQDGRLMKTGRRKTGWLYDFMGDALNDKVTYPYYLTLDRDTIHVFLQSHDGVLKLSTPRKRLFSKSTPLILIWTAVSAVLLFLVALLFMRNQIKPIWRLASAAGRFGKGQDVGVLRPEGASEVRKAIQAFNIMRDRLQRQLHERTELLAGVSHDLRTPLTRIRLQLAVMSQTPEVQALSEDVENMQHLTEAFIDFARQSEDEPMNQADLSILAAEIAKDIRSPRFSITLQSPEKVPWIIKIGFIKRCLTNLLLNSSQYATHCWVTITSKAYVVEILVDDNGPGIVEAERENVFRPFYRLDAAEGRESGGTGLGLSIARDAIRRHGGQIWLSDSPQGGLRVVIRLPR